MNHIFQQSNELCSIILFTLWFNKEIRVKNSALVNMTNYIKKTVLNILIKLFNPPIIW